MARGKGQPGGRPHRLLDEPDLVERMSTLIRTPMPATHAARIVRISETTYFRWMQEGAEPDAPEHLAEFHTEIELAKARAMETLVDLAMRNAIGVTRTRYGKEGELLEEYQESDPATVRFLLERMFPKQFGNRQTLEHTGVGGGAIEFELPKAAGEAAVEFVKALGRAADDAAEH